MQPCIYNFCKFKWATLDDLAFECIARVTNLSLRWHRTIVSITDAVICAYFVIDRFDGVANGGVTQVVCLDLVSDLFALVLIGGHLKKLSASVGVDLERARCAFSSFPVAHTPIS